MKKNQSFSKFLQRAMMLVAMVVMFATNSMAQLYWNGITNPGSGVITDNIILTGDVVLNHSTAVTITGSISGPYSISKLGSGTLTLAGINTYTGTTTISNGTVVIHSRNGLGNTNSPINLSSNRGTLRIETTQDMQLPRVIYGPGNVEFSGASGEPLWLGEDNTFTGTFTIEQGLVCLGEGYGTGSVVADIILAGPNAVINFGDSYTYSGQVSGTGGGVYVNGHLFNGVNTYTCETLIFGPFTLGTSGSIENSAAVNLQSGTAKLNISAGNKKIKALNSTYATAEVVLGTSVLTIGTSGESDGGGTFAGIFSGTGTAGVSKLGSGTFTMSGNSTATGFFAQYDGTVVVNGGKWAGPLSKLGESTILTIKGNPTIGGTFWMASSGEINMDVTAIPPSKISVTGNVVLSYIGTQTFNITATAPVTDYVLIEAASGITSTDSYILNVPNYPFASFLSVNAPTQLLLTAAAPGFCGGEGTSANPYLICTAADLAQLATLVNMGYSEYVYARYKLNNNINLSEYGTSWNGGKGWIPIGTVNNSFRGAFNGNGKVITGLYINDTDLNYAGLFGCIDGSRVEKIALENVNITGQNYVGGITGASYTSIISNCSSSGFITGNNAVGGMVGTISGMGELSNNYSSANISGAGNLGGIAGSSIGFMITNCYATGAITGTHYNIGGIAGHINHGAIQHCAALNPSVKGSTDVGRVLGVGEGGITLTNNVAFSGMLNNAGNTTWSNTGAGNIDGANMTAQTINTDGTLGNRFTAPEWTTLAGSLPGLNGYAVPMPAHLLYISFCGGSGTSGNPYQICTPQQLALLATLVNAGNTTYNDKYYILNNNIDLAAYGAAFNDGKGWIPIGTTDGNHFKGFFNGNNKVVTGLFINDPDSDFKGLFGNVQAGTITKLGVTDVNITASAYAGGLAGIVRGNSTISECYTTGNVSGATAIGGLVGRSEIGSNINNCYSTSSVSGTGGTIGGLVGDFSNGILSNSYATGNVSGGANVGGLVGTNVNAATIQNCVALNASVKMYNYNVGRVIGYNGGTLINNGAFDGMLNIDGNTTWSNIGDSDLDGADMNARTINENGTLGGRFTGFTWTTLAGYLPGLGGNPVEMPEHLKYKPTFCGGDGTSSNPYLICTHEDLADLATAVNNGDTDYNNKYYKLNNDLEFMLPPDGGGFNVVNWTPIGTQANPFLGTFDGNEKVISELYIYNPQLSYVGLFGSVQGTIKNLAVENVKITGKSHVGVIAGYILGSMSNCSSSGTVNGETSVGGVAGTINGFFSMTNCYSSAHVSGSFNIVGGIVGACYNATIANCYTTGTVTGNFQIGGIAGTSVYGTIQDCAALNSSVKAPDVSVGRVVGNNDNSTLTNNVAFDGMLNNNGATSWDNIGATDKDGADMTTKTINTDGTLGNRFTAPAWTTLAGDLPGLNGNTVEMPEHLKYKPTFCGGDGTSSNPYQICTPEDLADLAKVVNNSDTAYNNKHYILNNNLDLAAYGAAFNDGKGWIPIGAQTEYGIYFGMIFEGVFDGNGHVITGLYVNDAERDIVGLFGLVNGTVKNIGVESVNIIAKDFVGGIVGGTMLNGTIANCYSTGTVTGGNDVGGVVGSLNFTGSMIYDCYSSATVSGDSKIGGVVGSIVGSNSKVLNCYSIGAVSGTGIAIGGVVGYATATAAIIQNCAALNPSVKGTSGTGRVVVGTSGTRSNNIAFDGMLNNDGTTIWNNIGDDKNDGADITAKAINNDGSLGYRFYGPVWSIETGDLPGLFGNTVEMPEHLKYVLEFCDGDGTGSNPYQICDADQLQLLATRVNAGEEGYATAHYILVNDIDITPPQFTPGLPQSWTPIGTEDNPFKGVFDGNGKVITGLYFNNSQADEVFAGLFGDASDATIKNVALENVNINVAGNFAGAVAGRVMDGTISNCYSTGSISGGVFHTGGIVGQIKGTVSNCYSTAMVSGAINVGGVAGYLLSGTILSNCYATGSVSGSSNIGGVVGYAHYGTIQNCAALNPSVTASESDAGRVVGNYYVAITLTNNVAFSGMVNGGSTTWNNIGGNNLDGANMTAFTINNDGTLGSRFEPTAWTTLTGKLPGLFGNTVYMPQHLMLQIAFCDGAGTPQDPYQICTAEQLAILAMAVNNGDTDYNNKCYILNNNIDLSEFGASWNSGKGWIPIGSYTNNFKGNFHGNGKVVTGLYINNPSQSHAGLFGSVNEGYISELGVEDVNITADHYVGGLVGEATSSQIYGCYTTGSVNGTYDVGGLVGQTVYTSIYNCYSTCNVSGKDYGTGGLVGDNNIYSTISNCYATGNVSSSGVSGDVGGLVGINFNVIQNCVAMNTSITGTGDIGRITAYNHVGTGFVTNNYALSTMTVNGVPASGAHNDLNGANAAMADLKTRAFYLNFSNWTPQGVWNMWEEYGIWDICEDLSLPHLSWQAVECEEEMDEQIIPVIPGTNWISINVLNDNPTILKQLQNALEITGETKITGQSGSSQYMQLPFPPFWGWYDSPSSFQISEKEMYTFNITTNLDLNMVGTLADPATTEMTIKQGSNYIGYIPNSSASVEYALQDFDAVNGDKVTGQYGSATFYEIPSFGIREWSVTSGFTMNPGYGYVLSTSETSPRNFYYPSETPSMSAGGGSRGSITPCYCHNPCHWPFDLHAYDWNMTVHAGIYIDGVMSADEMLEVGVFCGDQIRGNACLNPLSGIFYTYFPELRVASVTVYSTTDDTFTIKVHNQATGREYNTTHAPVIFSMFATIGLPWEPIRVDLINNFDIITSVAPNSAAGYITGNNATMIHDVNTSLTLTAVAEDGYEFVNWTEGTNTYTDNTLTFIVTEDRNLVANFRDLSATTTYDIIVTIEPEESGTVTGDGEYEEGEEVTLTADPADCYEFSGWVEGGFVVSTENPYIFDADNNRTLVANFAPIEITPIFEGIVTEYCEGASIPALPTTSSNSITGAWSPAIDNTTTKTYTFTPAAGQCATTATVTIEITPKATPIFTGITTTYNEGATIPALPTTSDNEITGAWTPAINNMATTTYTFTPAPTECANTATLTITIIPVVVVEYTITVTIEPEESGTVEGAGIYEAGEEVELTATAADCFEFVNWTEDSEEVSTDNPYIFDADDNRTLVANFVPIVITPTFTGIVTEYCEGASIPALPTTSSNSITGAWSPAIDNTITKTYTFTPAVGQCATTATVTINITPKETPIFASVITTYTEGDDIPDLPLESDNGITGTWEPEINNMATTTYTFTPATTECAVGTTLTIVINPAPILVTQEIELGAGWNWISTNVLSTTPSILSQMKTSLNEVGIIIKGSGSYVQNEPPWMGSLKAISEKEMYQVQVTAGHTLTLTGTQADPATTPITVNNLWNWIGYVPAFATPVSAALTGLDPQDGDLIKGQTSFTQYYAIGSGIWMGSLKSLQSGAGYMYYSTNTAPKVFYYPSAPSKSPIIEYPSPYELKRTPKGNLYTGNMTITAIVVSNNKEVSSDALEIQAFCGSECRGSVLLSYEEVLDRYFGFLMVHGNGDEMITLKVYDHTTGKEYTAENAPFQFITNQIVGNITNPYPVDLGMIIGIDDITNEKVSIYPNPTKDQLFISHPWATLDVVEVADMYGRIILRQTNFSNSFISTKDIACGLYILKITNNNKTTILKFVKD